MTVKVTRQLKADFDYCMEYWKSLKDGFDEDDVLEARQVVILAVEDGRTEDCEKWFATEAARIREVLSQANGINQRIKARIEEDRKATA